MRENEGKKERVSERASGKYEEGYRQSRCDNCLCFAIINIFPFNLLSLFLTHFLILSISLYFSLYLSTVFLMTLINFSSLVYLTLTGFDPYLVYQTNPLALHCSRSFFLLLFIFFLSLFHSLFLSHNYLGGKKEEKNFLSLLSL